MSYNTLTFYYVFSRYNLHNIQSFDTNTHCSDVQKHPLLHVTQNRSLGTPATLRLHTLLCLNGYLLIWWEQIIENEWHQRAI